jgi:signal transduction histidine kinase
LKYQYKLEGAQNTWSESSAQRSVDFANLSPGDYRLLVKAVTADGIESSRPAVFTFTLLRPVWRRPWFLLLTGGALALALYALYRYRLARLLELERVRTRIATDLHDDIGSNLSLIAMLSEVTLRASQGNARMVESLSQIAGAAREVVDSMSDIVWAVNPKKDSVHDLTRRMRRFGAEIFSARNIAFKFHAPGEEQDAKLGADIRREVFLIFKEAINNIARHSDCAEAEIELQIAAGWMLLKLRDNGKGFDASAASDGAGLMSMRQRAERLGGKFELSSSNGAGATVTLKVPLRRRA